MTITLGNDISKWQGDVNFDIFKNNTQFVIFKATEGNGYTDPKFARNQTESRRVALLCGYYHFARPDLGNTPEAEAEWFLKTIGELREGELLALDYECPNQKQSDVDWCKRWLDFVFARTGVRAFIYLNQSQIKNFDWQSVINGSYALWVAAYTYDPYKNIFTSDEFKTAAMQQWSNKQTVPGVNGGVDGNVFFGSLDTLKKYGYKKPEPPKPQPPVEIVVTDGKTIIALGKINDLDYGNMRLEDIKRGLGEKDNELGQSRQKLVDNQIEIGKLNGQIETLKAQVGQFDIFISMLKKFLGL